MTVVQIFCSLRAVRDTEAFLRFHAYYLFKFKFSYIPHRANNQQKYPPINIPPIQFLKGCNLSDVVTHIFKMCQ